MNRSSLGGVIGLAAFFLAVSPQSLYAELRLHYAMDGSGFGDRGSLPAAPGTEVNSTYVTYESPAGFSCGALDVEDVTGNNYLTTETDVEKSTPCPP